jgi:hypothetical protein
MNNLIKKVTRAEQQHQQPTAGEKEKEKTGVL